MIGDSELNVMCSIKLKRCSMLNAVQRSLLSLRRDVFRFTPRQEMGKKALSEEIGARGRRILNALDVLTGGVSVSPASCSGARQKRSPPYWTAVQTVDPLDTCVLPHPPSHGVFREWVGGPWRTPPPPAGDGVRYGSDFASAFGSAGSLFPWGFGRFRLDFGCPPPLGLWVGFWKSG